MRKLIVLRGPQGAGKSTFIRQQKLDAYVICPDHIRQIFSGPVMGETGKLGINQSHDSRVWRMVKQLVFDRMSRGELLVIDATHRASRDFKLYLQYAKEFRYQIFDIKTNKL